MFKLRQEQMAAFTQAVLQNFEDRMVVHLNQFFPEQCTMLGEPKVRETIRYGIQRAASHGIVVERDVCKYLDLMFAFGPDFDQDPRHPWAAEILNDPKTTDPETRLKRLCDTGREIVR